ncbi:uncharacterized protein LOC142317805 [Lycorma delicatula]|uniref:uncharacterized protein LOC142317805 n=1 Tax=Lycorma delicatula TaxID=130591 RepID=UPI003F512D33
MTADFPADSSKDISMESSTLSTNLNSYENISKKLTYVNGINESRGWKKTALPFLLGLTLKMTTLLPMVSSLMTIIGGVSLLASKLALFLSIGLAFHYYLVTKQHMQRYSQQQLSHYDSVLPVNPYPITHKLSVQAS